MTEGFERIPDRTRDECGAEVEPLPPGVEYPRSLSPTDADFDDMHHALGRPDGRHVTPYRNYFAIDQDSADAKRFEELGHYWLRGPMISGGLRAYSVTPHGIENVMAWLELRQRAAGKRPWRVSGDGITERVVIAKSSHAAKYDVFLEVSDFLPGGFRDFLRLGVRARAA